MADFGLGRVMITPGCLAALEESKQMPLEFLDQHFAGNWGDCCREDAAANDAALKNGGRIFSVFHTSADVKIWVITEGTDESGVRSSTCLLLPSEY